MNHDKSFKVTTIHASTRHAISTRDCPKRQRKNVPTTLKPTGDCSNYLEKQPSLSIVQKVKQKNQFSSLGRGYAAAPPSASHKQQRTVIKKPLMIGPKRYSFRSSRLRHARRNCRPVGQWIKQTPLPRSTACHRTTMWIYINPKKIYKH
ncbi:hypothetical protein TNCV_46341 [Trichonephila clavipes]|nr:hypothetical protein TNCV_46341 [Trichonephila clavipes]